MGEDEDFDPRLGRMRALGSARGRKYLHRVLASAALAGGPKRAGGGRFDGSRIGRGAAMARLLGSRSRLPLFQRRRGIVKTRLVRLGSSGLAAARAHLSYIQRDGAGRDGSPGQLYDRDQDRADGKAFLARATGDRHQFRFIVSAEDGADYEDLKPLVRRFMARMEADLGTRLDWVAVDHRDTGHPHSHIMLRGRDDEGQNLVIARDYIARGMRERLAELVTLDLGPRQDWEIRKKLRREISAERLTSIDRGLIRDRNSAGILSGDVSDPFRQALRAGRLKKLEAMGLAEPLGGGKWRLSNDIEHQLRRLGERGDIIRTMQRELTAQGIDRVPADRVIHGDIFPETAIVGQVIARGLSDEIADRHFLIVDAVDGRVHYIDIGRSDAVEALPEGAIVRALRREAGARASDRLVAEIAATNGGRYSVDLHLKHDPAARTEFAEAHIRRLEAIRRGGGKVERLDDGSWIIHPDHIEEAAAYERRRVRLVPVRVELMSPLPLAELVERNAATWLDRELVGDGPELLRDAGFGREVRSALALRRQWLMREQLAHEGPDGLVYSNDLLATLRRRELMRVAGQIGQELGLDHVEAGEGMRISGRIERRLDLASGRFALIVNSREFSLVPWRPSMERQLGRELELRAGSAGVSWTVGRGRGGPEIG